MLYACDNCHYLFPATSEEQEEYKNREKENLWTEDSNSCRV